MGHGMSDDSDKANTTAKSANVAVTTREIRVLTAASARRVIDAGIGEAAANGWAMTIAIADPAGDLIALHRMDGANLVTIDTAIAKARSAARMGVPTRYLHERLVAGELAMLAIPGINPLGGGAAIMVDGVATAAIGVSGGTLEADLRVAKVGAAAAA